MFGEYIDEMPCVLVLNRMKMTGPLVEAEEDEAENELDGRFLAFCDELEAMDEANPVSQTA